MYQDYKIFNKNIIFIGQKCHVFAFISNLFISLKQKNLSNEDFWDSYSVFLLYKFKA